MYTNYNKKRDGSTRFFFTAISAIAAVLVIVAVISSPTFFVKKTGPEDLTTPHATLPPSPPDSTSATPPKTQETDTLPLETTAQTTAASPQESTAPETTAPPVTSAPDTTPVAPPETSAHITVADPALNPCVLAETEDAGQAYLDKIIFIGDSTTYSFLYYGKLSGGKESLQVWTPASRTLTLDHAVTTTILYPDTGEEITIKEALSRKKPEIIVITLGVNGISYMNEEYFISSYKKLVNMIAKESPDTKIILQSIFPVATNWEKTKSINNEKINNANKWIRNVADACSVRYLDTISVLATDEGGYLPQKLQNGDGLHLNGTGCDIALKYIRTHALPDYIK